MDIRYYTFEHLVLNNNEENTSASSEESGPEADSNPGYRYFVRFLARQHYVTHHKCFKIQFTVNANVGPTTTPKWSFGPTMTKHTLVNVVYSSFGWSVCSMASFVKSYLR